MRPKRDDSPNLFIPLTLKHRSKLGYGQALIYETQEEINEMLEAFDLPPVLDLMQDKHHLFVREAGDGQAAGEASLIMCMGGAPNPLPPESMCPECGCVHELLA